MAMRASAEAHVPAPAAPNVLGRALRGGSYLFLQKMFTFALNSFILRRLHLRVTGAVTVQFELALASVFVFRDAFRLAFLRAPAQLDVAAVVATEALTVSGTALKAGLEAEQARAEPAKTRVDMKTTKMQAARIQRQQLVNVTWLSTLLSWSLAVGIIVVSIWRHNVQGLEETTDSSGEIQHYGVVLVLYCIAAMLEALAEPIYLLAHSSMLVGWAVMAQGAGFLVRGVVQYVAIFAFQWDGLLSYGIAEVGYGLSLFLVLLWCLVRKLQENRKESTVVIVMQSIKELLPRRVGSENRLFDRNMIALLVPLTVQSIVKYLLTEGDKWVLSLFTTLQQMGIYGIVFHLGSLVPRILFLPLEEATKTISSKMAASAEQNKNQVKQTHDFLCVLLKVMHLIGLTFICFGVNYAHTAVLVLYGVEKVESGVGTALAMYCVYIFFLGINGICEAFVQATGTRTQLMRLNRLMGVFFGIYAASALLFIRVLQLETLGIILANCINMACRILYCITEMAKFFAAHDLRAASNANMKQTIVSTVLSFWHSTLPDRFVLVGFSVAFGVGALSQRLVLAPNPMSWFRNVIHVAVGGICFVLVLATLWFRERRLLRDQIRQLRRGDAAKTHAE